MTSGDCNGIFQLNYNQFLIWQQALLSVAHFKIAQQKESISSSGTDFIRKGNFSVEVNLILNSICFVTVIINTALYFRLLLDGVSSAVKRVKLHIITGMQPPEHPTLTTHPSPLVQHLPLMEFTKHHFSAWTHGRGVQLIAVAQLEYMGGSCS